MDALLDERLREMEIAEGVTDSLSNLVEESQDPEIDEGTDETVGNLPADEGKEEEGEEGAGSALTTDEKDRDRSKSESSSSSSDGDWEKVPGPDWIDLLGNGQLLKEVSSPLCCVS